MELALQFENFSNERTGVVRLFCEPIQEKTNPRYPLILITHIGKQVVVVPPMLLKLLAHVHIRSGEYLPTIEKQRNKEAPNTTVAIIEGVDCFKLIVGNG